jgi:outer membrane protein OmpA-like peptidoglycan-associated protein
MSKRKFIPLFEDVEGDNKPGQGGDQGSGQGLVGFKESPQYKQAEQSVNNAKNAIKESYKTYLKSKGMDEPADIDAEVKSILQAIISGDGVDEGWGKNMLVGVALSLATLFGAGASAQDVTKDNPDGTSTRTHKTTDSSSIQTFLREGWTLDSTQLDTIYNEIKTKAPKTEVSVTRLQVDKTQQFGSGKFELGGETTTSLDSVFAELEKSNSLLVKVEITSSTDKQAVGPELQKILKGMNLSADNQGLSVARSNSVKGYLESKFGLSDSIINVVNKVEQGEGKVDDNARFVMVDFYYINKGAEQPSADKGSIKSVNKSYTLSKTTKPGDGSDNSSYTKPKFKLKLPSISISLGSIGTQGNRGSLGCPSWRH